MAIWFHQNTFLRWASQQKTDNFLGRNTSSHTDGINDVHRLVSSGSGPFGDPRITNLSDLRSIIVISCLKMLSEAAMKE